MRMLRNNINANTESNVDRGSFFRDGVPFYFVEKPRMNEQTGMVTPTPRVRLLPSLDLSLESMGGDEFKLSVLPYKQKDNDEYSLTDWAVKVRGYTFFGENKISFLSPLTLEADWGKNMPNRFAPKNKDPITDLKNFIFFNSDMVKVRKYPKAFDTNPWVPLIKQEGKRASTLPDTSNFYIVNALLMYPGTNQWVNSCVVLKATAFQYLKTLSEEKTNFGETPFDDNFPQFMFGDFTGINKGIVFDVGVLSTGTSGNTTGGIVVPNTKSLKGAQSFDISDNADFLRNRSVLHDLTNTLHILTYEEILNLMVKDSSIPNEIIQLCDNFGGFKRTFFAGDSAVADITRYVTGEVAPSFGQSQQQFNVSTPPRFVNSASKQPQPVGGVQHNVAFIGNSATVDEDDLETDDQIPMDTVPTVSQSQVSPKSTPVQVNQEDLTVEIARYEELAAKLNAHQLTDTAEIREYYKLLNKFGK